MPHKALRLAATLCLLAGLPSPTHAGVSDTPLPTFSDGKPALLAALIPTVVKNNQIESAVLCTNLATAAVDVGLEVFDQTGVRGNTIAMGNGALLGVMPGQTVTIATGATAVLHEDAVVTLEAPVTGLRNGSARVVATSDQVGCVAFAVDRLHTIADPAVCPTCPPPSLTTLPVSAAPTTGPTPTPTSATPTRTATALPTPLPTPVCGSTPEADCRTPAAGQKGRLLLKDNAADDSRDLLIWKWLVGAATMKSEFGDPVSADAYELCIYDGTPALISSATAPAGGLCHGKPCWRESATGFKYRDAELSPDGLLKILLRGGVGGSAKIVLKGKGVALDMPAPPIANSPVTVQLRNSSGACWGAVYSFPPSMRNETGRFLDRAD